MCTYESSDSKLNRLRNGKFDFHFLRKTKEEADLDFFSHLLKNSRYRAESQTKVAQCVHFRWIIWYENLWKSPRNEKEINVKSYPIIYNTYTDSRVIHVLNNHTYYMRNYRIPIRICTSYRFYTDSQTFTSIIVLSILSVTRIILDNVCLLSRGSKHALLYADKLLIHNDPAIACNQNKTRNYCIYFIY